MAGARRYNRDMSGRPEVLVIGGGVIGLTAAYFLARDGASVEIIDRADFGREASWAGAGILPPVGDRGAAEPVEQFRRLSARLFPRLSEDLKDRTGIDNGYRRCGGIEFADESDVVVGEWRQAGVQFERLSEVDLRRTEPALAEGVGAGYVVPGMAQVRNPRHLQALVAACRSLGVTLRSGCSVEGLDTSGDRVTAARTSEGPFPAGRFVLATGAWTDELAGPLRWRPGVRPVRGQIALVAGPPALLRRVVIRGKQYLVPREDGRVLVGSTEEEAGFDKRTTALAVADLLVFAARLVPALGGAPVEACWAGLRPASADGLPLIGRVPGWENAFVAAGHFRAGIELSPATGVAVTDLVLDRPLTADLAPFSPSRAPVKPVVR